MALGNKIQDEAHRRLLRMYELQHRTHIVDGAVATVFAVGIRRPMRGPTYQVIKVAYEFIRNNDTFARWMHRAHQVDAVQWVTKVTYGRFSSFGAGAWILLSPVAAGQPALWDVLGTYLATYPGVYKSTERYSQLKGWVDDQQLRDHANVLVAIYLKISLPFARRSARVVTYGDAQRLVNDTVGAVSNWDDDRMKVFFSPDVKDVYGKPVVKPLLTSSSNGVTERCRSIARQRMLLGCETVQLCAACGETAAAPTVQCDRCHEWYHPHCQDIDGFELWRLWYCSACLPMTVPVAPAPEAYAPLSTHRTP